ncbi:MAG: hypothetical protein OEU26_23630 [Candidatus Tectomicrobia bacterium]|nr:hypothetical protein [Candidatus Tectomicrobia bacterium]
MKANPFEQPGVWGRGIRLAAGIGFLTLFVATLINPMDWLRETVMGPENRID